MTVPAPPTPQVIRGRRPSPGGYNSARLVRTGGYDLLVLALDWRVSQAGLTWAQQAIDAHPAPRCC